MVIQHSRPTGSRVVSTLRLCVWLGVFFATSLRLLLLARANDDGSNQDFFQQVALPLNKEELYLPQNTPAKVSRITRAEYSPVRLMKG